jgi:hypothetical protein
VNSSYILSFLLLVCLISGATPQVDGREDRALKWFHSEYGYFFRPSLTDTTPPIISDVAVAPSNLKVGDPRAEISADIYDPVGIKIAYAEVGDRMNLMLDVMRTNHYIGYCGSNLPSGTYKVTIVAIDKAGNAARYEAASLTMRNPRDLNGNHIEDSLEKQMDKDLRVIILHDDNLLVPGEDRFKILPGSSMIVPGSKLDELAHFKGVNGIYKDQKLKVQTS